MIHNISEMNIGNTADGFEISVDKAKEQLTRIVTTYLEKDADGKLVIPFNRQRPVMLMGASGIGKTDAPCQVARELGIGFVSYSMTHHTRQSALGLPKIIEKEYEGKGKIATEYTMSEIISAVYDEIKRSGNPNGILFLDEINCTSESLSAVMLQLFQNKTLGQSQIPEGWVLIMAGNPPEYNKSVKAFDAVTRDRLRIINVVPDADAWLKYAENKKLNCSVVSFINSDKSKIYIFDSTKMQIVTPRGWEELSINLDAYEKHGFAVDGELISEFISVPSVASEFFDYYKMVKENICETDIEQIINGNVDSKLAKKISSCKNKIKYVLITYLKKKLHTYSEKRDYLKATEAMDNIVSFIGKVYGNNGEMEIFMSSILSDAEIVKMTVLTGNKSFGKYLNEITTAEENINNQIKKSRRKEAK